MCFREDVGEEMNEQFRLALLEGRFIGLFGVFVSPQTGSQAGL